MHNYCSFLTGVRSKTERSTHYKQILARPHAGTKDRRGTRRANHGCGYGPHLSSNNQEHPDVGGRNNNCYYHEVDGCKYGRETSALPCDIGDHDDPIKICFRYTDINWADDDKAERPDGTDYCTQGAISEDGKVGERSNNNGTFDDRHGSQMPEGAHAESVHTAVDYSQQPRWNLFTGLQRPRHTSTAARNYTVHDVRDSQWRDDLRHGVVFEASTSKRHEDDRDVGWERRQGHMHSTRNKYNEE